MKTSGYFRIAKKAASNSDNRRYKVGAVLVKGSNHFIGFNSSKTHPMMHKLNELKTVHAEVAAISKSKINLHGSEIYVFRQDKSGKPRMAKPCLYCAKALKHFGIKKVYYTINDGWESEKIK